MKTNSSVFFSVTTVPLRYACLLPMLLLLLVAASCQQTDSSDSGQELRSASVYNAPGERSSLNAGWRFMLDNSSDFSSIGVDDSQWRVLDLPHDFSIEGEIDENNPTGRRGGYFPGGIGWYRKVLEWDQTWEGRRLIITFDGVMMRSDFFVNGERVAGRPYGYLGFTVDITDYVTPGEKIFLAVRADNVNMPSGRWYTGSGIYRNVWLDVRDPIHFTENGSWARTVSVSDTGAVVKISHEIINKSADTANVTIEANISREGAVAATATTQVDGLLPGEARTVDKLVTINNPLLWTAGDPNLYDLNASVKTKKGVADEKQIRLGIRTIEATVEKGLLVNGEPVELQGVCLHHDAGPVGAAVPYDVLRRRMVLLKDMGVNAIRVGHTPFAPEFYDLADEMGFMVMNEAFDGWESEKAAFDYGLFFEDHWQEDLTYFIRRDRKHPSVIFWSIGNEVRHGTNETQQKLFAHIRGLDDTRLLTQAEGHRYGWGDVVGFNGHGELKGVIEEFHEKHPDVTIVGTEITHTLHTRDVYRSKTEYRTRDNPAPWELQRADGRTPAQLWDRIKDGVHLNKDLTEEEVWPEEPLYYASSFDNNLVRMSIRDSVKLSERLPYLLGTFRWTGFDYLGESYGWPARTANFGVIDLAGFEKGVYYLYQSLWSDEPMVHLDPHWTHPNKQGQSIPVVVYTNMNEAELFLNGKSLGRKSMTDEMQIVWEVPYEEGTISAVAYGADGGTVSATRRTAYSPKKIKLSSDREIIKSDSASVAHIEIDIVDENGVRVPSAAQRLNVQVDGPGRLIGLENGDILDLQSTKDDNRKAFKGKLLALVQSTSEPGDIKLTVSGEGLEPATLSLVSAE